MRRPKFYGIALAFKPGFNEAYQARKYGERQALSIHLHHGDLPADVSFGDSVAIDTETQGLNPLRDRPCLVQLSAGDGVCHLVKFAPDAYQAPNLKRLLVDTSVEKIFHFARFDVAVMRHWLGIEMTPVYCTKIASKLVRTYTDRHSLSVLVKELCGTDMSKQQQSSDWAAPELSDAQLEYAASDVLYLHRIKATLDAMLAREGRTHLAKACFDFLPTRAALDLGGWEGTDIFAHS